MLEVKVRCAACAAPRSAPTRPDRAGVAGKAAGETPASMRRTILTGSTRRSRHHTTHIVTVRPGSDVSGFRDDTLQTVYKHPPQSVRAVPQIARAKIACVSVRVCGVMRAAQSHRQLFLRSFHAH